MVVAHNISSLFTNSQLNISTGKLSKNTEKLSSGYRINRAADDAAGLTISEKMRWQIRGLNQDAENIQDGVSFTNTADGALNEIDAILQRQRELLVQAGNDTNTVSDKQAIEDELSALSEEFDRIFDDTEFNTRKIFKGNYTIVNGPTEDTSTKTEEKIGDPKTSTSTKVLWLNKSLTEEEKNAELAKYVPNYPTEATATTTKTVPSHKEETYFSQSETALSSEAADGTPLYLQSDQTVKITTDSTTTTQTTSTITKEEEDTSDYYKLKSPATMTGQNGYINVTNKTGELQLSCMMSQLGIQIVNDSGSVSTQYTDLYKSGLGSTTSTENTATTTYDVGNGITLSQTIKLDPDANTYTISYSVSNSESSAKKVNVRLAFDVLNAPTKSSDLSDTIKSYSLSNDNASITLTSDADQTALGRIEDLYDTWKDHISSTSTVVGHTGVGSWWNDRTVPANGSIDIGSVTYGPIEVNKECYTITQEITSQTNSTIKNDYKSILTTIKPEILQIQAGALKGQTIGIRQWDLSAEKLACTVPDEISAFNVDYSLRTVDRVLDKINSIRAYYGATTNRLEHAYSNVQSTSENTQSAESQLRDTNMAAEMVQYSANNILMQAGQSMLTQANSQTRNVLQLLQG